MQSTLTNFFFCIIFNYPPVDAQIFKVAPFLQASLVLGAFLPTSMNTTHFSRSVLLGFVVLMTLVRITNDEGTHGSATSRKVALC